MNSAMLDGASGAESKRLAGVYYILNRETGGSYVGSTGHMVRRWRYHRQLLRRNRHHSPRLQNAWNKYGEDKFLFLIAVRTPGPDEARLLEQSVLSNRANDFYNASRVVDFGLMMRQPRTAEHKKRIGDALRGKPKSAEHVERMRVAFTGKKHPPRSEGWRKSLSVANAGKAPWIKGQQQSVEHFTRIQLARKRFFAESGGKPFLDLELA